MIRFKKGQQYCFKTLLKWNKENDNTYYLFNRHVLNRVIFLQDEKTRFMSSSPFCYVGTLNGNHLYNCIFDFYPETDESFQNGQENL